jgi:hypothetical protein
LVTTGIDTLARLLTNGELSYKDSKDIVDDVYESFKTTFDDFEDTPTLIKSDFLKATNAIYKKYKKPLIVFLDDLDRCLPDNTLTLIELLKNYFNVGEAKVIFIFGQNPRVTKDFIKQKYPKLSTSFVNDYYKKIFDICIPFPKVSDEGTKKYIISRTGTFFDGAGQIVDSLLSYNNQFKNKSLRVIEKVIYDYYFLKNNSRDLPNEFLIFWCFSREITPQEHYKYVEILLEKKEGILGDITSHIETELSESFRDLYKQFHDSHSSIKISSIVENIL